MDLQDDVNKKVEAGIEKVISYAFQLAELTEETFKKNGCWEQRPASSEAEALFLRRCFL